MVKLNKNNIFLAIFAIGMYFFLISNKKPILFAENGNLYIDSKDNIVEFMTNYVPDDLQAGTNDGDLALRKWHTDCIGLNN